MNICYDTYIDEVKKWNTVEVGKIEGYATAVIPTLLLY